MTPLQTSENTPGSPSVIRRRSQPSPRAYSVEDGRVPFSRCSGARRNYIRARTMVVPGMRGLCAEPFVRLVRLRRRAPFFGALRWAVLLDLDVDRFGSDHGFERRVLRLRDASSVRHREASRAL